MPKMPKLPKINFKGKKFSKSFDFNPDEIANLERLQRRLLSEEKLNTKSAKLVERVYSEVSYLSCSVQEKALITLYIFKGQKARAYKIFHKHYGI